VEERWEGFPMDREVLPCFLVSLWLFPWAYTHENRRKQSVETPFSAELALGKSTQTERIGVKIQLISNTVFNRTDYHMHSRSLSNSTTRTV
jgi:hypothetical protein